jgi:hypothetical protein
MSQPWLMDTGFLVRAPTVTCHRGSGSLVARFTRLAVWGERAGGSSKEETSTGIQTLKWIETAERRCLCGLQSR